MKIINYTIKDETFQLETTNNDNIIEPFNSLNVQMDEFKIKQDVTESNEFGLRANKYKKFDEEEIKNILNKISENNTKLENNSDNLSFKVKKLFSSLRR